MTSHWTIWAAAAGFVAGMAVGGAHFAALGWNVRLFASRRLALALGAQVLRCALSAALLFVLVRAGAGALLAGMAGLLIARQAALRVAVSRR